MPRGNANRPAETRRAPFWSSAAASGVYALVGALIGGLFTYFAATAQIKGESQRSRDEFLRSQRQTAYANVVTDSTDLQAQEAGYAHSITYNLPDRKQRANSLFTKLQKWTNDWSVVRIIGSNEAVDTARDLDSEIIGYQGELVDRDEKFKTGMDEPQRWPQQQKDNAEGARFNAAQSAFIAAASKDLGGPSGTPPTPVPPPQLSPS
jgi:hypothetical protein